MGERVIDQIGQGLLERVGVAVEHDRLVGRRQRDVLARGMGDRRDPGKHLAGERGQVDRLVMGHLMCLQPCNSEQLVDHPGHPIDVAREPRGLLAVAQPVDTRAQHRERRAQRVGGVRGKPLLLLERVLDPVDRLVHRGDQRQDLARRAVFAQAQADGFGAELARLTRQAAHRTDRAADGEADDQQGRDRQRDENRQRGLDRGLPDPAENVLESLLAADQPDPHRAGRRRDQADRAVLHRAVRTAKREIALEIARHLGPGDQRQRHQGRAFDEPAARDVERAEHQLGHLLDARGETHRKFEMQLALGIGLDRFADAGRDLAHVVGEIDLLIVPRRDQIAHRREQERGDIEQRDAPDQPALERRMAPHSGRTFIA